MTRGIIIAGERSGVGKTTLTLSLAQIFINLGLKVQCFKVGPDFIDPSYHQSVTGRLSRNLDGWMMGREYCINSFKIHGRDADMVLVEGVMGLFDGYDSKSENGSTAQIAKWLNLPVILIVDGSSLARSAGAIVLGFENYDSDVEVSGIIFNKVAGKQHFTYLREAVEQSCKAKVLGYVSRNYKWSIPERHLGLVMAGEVITLKQSINKLSQAINKNFLINEIIQIARMINLDKGRTYNEHISLNSQEIKIGVALDEAFCFYYQDNIESLERHGAEIIFFSPIHDKNLPQGIKGLYLGGGYPELHALALSKNESMRREILTFCKSEKPVYAECGGLLYLLQAITDQNCVRHEMVSLFPSEGKMRSRLQRLGYVEIEAQNGCPFMKKGEKVRGHEFHYSDINEMPSAITRCYKVERKKGQAPFFEGYRMYNVLASYVHLHFASNSEFTKNFIKMCRQVKNV